MPKRKALALQVEATADASTSLPAVGTFSSGIPKALHDGSCKLKLYRNRDKANQNIIVGEAAGVDYVGHTHGHSAALPCHYAVAVHDKDTGKVQLVPVLGGRVCRLEAKLHSVDYGASAHDPGAHRMDGKDRAQQTKERIAAIAEFGSQRIKRELIKREAGRVTTNVAGGVDANITHLGSAIDAANVGKTVLSKEQRAERVLAAQPRPEHNPEATTGTEAYVLRQLVPAAAWEALDTQRLLKFATWLDSPPEADSDDAQYFDSLKKRFPHYVRERAVILNTFGVTDTSGVHKEQKTPAEEERIYRARCLAFLAALLRINHAKARRVEVDPDDDGMQGAANKLKMKPEVLEALLDKFYGEPTFKDDDERAGVAVYALARNKGELIKQYICITALLAEGCDMGYSAFYKLAQQLGEQTKAISNTMRYLGATSKRVVMPKDELPRMSRVEAQARQAFSYNVALLTEDNGEPLRRYFPKLKKGAPKNR